MPGCEKQTGNITLNITCKVLLYDIVLFDTALFRGFAYYKVICSSGHAFISVLIIHVQISHRFYLQNMMLKMRHH